MFRFLPEQASSHAADVDAIHNLITDLSVFFTVAIVGAMLYFAIRYRRRDGKDHDTPRLEGSHALEVVWTVIPTVVSIFIAYGGIKVYHEMREVPANALTIQVWAQKWQWSFQYDYRDAQGKEQSKKIGGKNVEWVVPVNRPVKLVLQSRDVLHSFFIPAMRVKRDAIPGQWNYLTFTPIHTGTFPVFCTEYCGKEHSNMMATLRVVSEVEYENWLKDRSAETAIAGMTPMERGKKLYVEKGCNACHSLDGSRMTGPSYMKLFMAPQKLQDGSTAMADEQYLHESILYPAKQVVDGFANVMPGFEGQLSEDDVADLISFIKAQDGTQPVAVATKAPENDAGWEKLTPAQRGEKWVKSKAVPACTSCHSLDGSKLVGPSLKGVFGREEQMTDGSKVTVDAAYITESILNPGAKIVKDFMNMMPPSYAAALKEQDIKDIIEFLKTLK